MTSGNSTTISRDQGTGPAPASPRLWLCLALVIAASVLAYTIDPGRSFPLGGALAADFAFDDLYLIVNNSRLQSPSGALDGFTSDYYATSEVDPSGKVRALGYYRPIAVFSNWLDATIWNVRPLGFHLTNLLLHVGVGISLFFFVQHLASRRIALASALLFAVHPVHPESVTFISGRVDVLAALFSVLSLLWLIRSFRSSSAARLRAISLVFFLLALLSKEAAIVLPAAVFLLYALFGPDAAPLLAGTGRPRQGLIVRSLSGTLPYLGVIAIYAIVRLIAIGSLLSRAGASDGGDLWPRVARVVSTYLGYLIWPPFRFNVEPPVAIAAGIDGGVLLRTVLCLAVAAAGAALAFRRRWPIMGFALLWTGAALLPVSQILPVETLIAERYLYIPSLGASIALAAGIDRLILSRGASAIQLPGSRRSARERAFWAAVAVAAIAYGASTVHRNGFWKDNFTFWTAKVAMHDQSAEAHTALGSEQQKRGLPEDAIRSYQRALQIDSNHVEALNNLALLLLERGHADQALQAASQIVRVTGTYAVGLNTLATCFHSLGYFGEAVGQYKRALRLRPDYREAWINLGNTYFTVGAVDSARRAYEEAVELEPDPQLQLQVAQCYARGGNVPQAMEYLRGKGFVAPGSAQWFVVQGTLEQTAGDPAAATRSLVQATQIDPLSAGAWVELGQVLAANGAADRAREALEEALSIDPTLSAAHNNLGALAEDTGDLEEAVERYRRALELAPTDPEVMRNLGGALMKLERHEEALALLDRSAELAPRDPLTLYNRARSHHARGSVSEALYNYRAVTLLRPSFPDAHLELARLLVATGKGPDALPELELFLNFTPPDDARRPVAIALRDSLAARYR